MHIFQHELKKTHIYSNILQFPYPSNVKKKKPDKDFLNTVHEYIGKENVEYFFSLKKNLNSLFNKEYSVFNSGIFFIKIQFFL